MIGFLYMHVFYAKKRVFLSIAFIGVIVLMILFVYTKDSIYEQSLFQSFYQQYYEQLMGKLLMILLPFFVVLLSMDHDQAYLKPLVSYFGRSYVATNKIVLYLLVLTWLYAMIFLLYQIIPYLMTNYYIINRDASAFFLHLYLDGIIVLLLVLYFIKDCHKSLAVIIPIFYFLFTFIQEDYESLLLIYAFPIYSAYFASYTLAYLYKLCYICLGLTVLFHKMKVEQI